MDEGSAAAAITTTTSAADAVDAAGGGGSSSGSIGSRLAAAAAPSTSTVPAAAVAAAPPGGWWSGEAAVKVAGSYGSKVEAVVRRVVFILSSDPLARILVFSGWSDLLDILAHALRCNGVEPGQARGRQGFVRAVEEFKAGAAEDEKAAAAAAAAVGASGLLHPGGTSLQQQELQQEEHEPAGLEQQEDGKGQGEGQLVEQHSPGLQGRRSSVRVLLLLVSQGGLGLNLTEAQHVILVEPLLDPALEVQAIGRVHRFGQKRMSHVHRFMVRGGRGTEGRGEGE